MAQQRWGDSRYVLKLELTGLGVGVRERKSQRRPQRFQPGYCKNKDVLSEMEEAGVRAALGMGQPRAPLGTKFEVH